MSQQKPVEQAEDWASMVNNFWCLVESSAIIFKMSILRAFAKHVFYVVRCNGKHCHVYLLIMERARSVTPCMRKSTVKSM